MMMKFIQHDDDDDDDDHAHTTNYHSCYSLDKK